MNKKQSKKFLVIFLPIIALVVAIISIVGGVVASNKANPVLEVIGKEGVTTGESSEEEVVEEKTYTISGCTFSGTGTHLVVKSGTNYIVEDCTFSGKEGETSTGSAIKVEGGTLTLNNSTVENIETTVDGTGINVATSGTLTLNSSTIRNCKTIGSGGAIYSEGSVIIKGDSLISNNSAGTGGAIWSLNSLSILGNTNIVENGNSNSVGGGIYSSGVIKLGSDDEAWTGKISDNIASIGHGIYSWKQI